MPTPPRVRNCGDTVLNTLIAKLNATGDVVRTTTLLRRLTGQITWITAATNAVLLENTLPNLRCLAWANRALAADARYDLVINLEDEREVAAFLHDIECERLFGAHLDRAGSLTYTADSRGWFDLSLISRFGRECADKLKLRNRSTYQDLVFEGLGMHFEGETYVLPRPVPTELTGDVAIASASGPMWPMKTWAYYDELRRRLESAGLRVNVLPRRATLLEHLGDVANHRCIVGGDSLPMHFALGTGTPCVTLFNCTSPWEIHDYGVQTKVVSPVLERFFYRRDFDPSATTAISVDDLYQAVMACVA